MTRTAFVLALALAGLAHAQEPAAPPELPADAQGLEPGLYARLETSMGVMIARLEPERAKLTTANFVGLIEGTREWHDPKTGQRVKRPYYDGLIFHRVIEGFMIQGGCPLGTGMGGPGYTIPDELNPELKHDKAGILSMAKTERPHTGGSQFFITLGPTPHLDGKHSVFGHLVRGEDVLKRIGAVKTGAEDRPLAPVTITKATVLRVGSAPESWDLNRPVPACESEADPARVAGAEQPARPKCSVKVICIQWAGVYKCAAHVKRTKEEAHERARQLLPHARAKGSDFEALSRKWSDLPGTVFELSSSTDASFAPAFKLARGQVSDPLETPFGYMIVEGQ